MNSRARPVWGPPCGLKVVRSEIRSLVEVSLGAPTLIFGPSYDETLVVLVPLSTYRHTRRCSLPNPSRLVFYPVANEGIRSSCSCSSSCAAHCAVSCVASWVTQSCARRCLTLPRIYYRCVQSRLLSKHKTWPHSPLFCILPAPSFKLPVSNFKL